MSDAKENQSEYRFALILSGMTELTTEIENAVFEAGCDDASLGVCCGRASLEFCRDADSPQDAILSAIADIRKTKVGLAVVRVDACNPVSQSDQAQAMEVIDTVNATLELATLRERNPKLVEEVQTALTGH